MAAGTPVVCSEIPGFRAVASGAAVLVVPGDPGLLADGLKGVLEDAAAARRMTTAGSRTANAFSWDRLVGNVESIYARAVERAPMRVLRRDSDGPGRRGERSRQDVSPGRGRDPRSRGVDVTVMPGEFLAVTGASGSGKSTLLHILGGLDRPDSGEVWLDGLSIAGLSDEELALIRRRRLGFVLQFFNLLPTMNAAERTQLSRCFSTVLRMHWIAPPGPSKRLALRVEPVTGLRSCPAASNSGSHSHGRW